jgi:GT2 family glycosyltransferase
MEAQVPAVVAVVVTTGASPWLEESLASLAAQHYEELSVLVLVTGDGPDPSVRVGRILPEAFVRRLLGRPGYAAASNEALGMVEGTAFFLLCHDDCALDPDVVHNLVEESFRSNAGVVSPKYVHWDDPSVLLHVGQNCDKTGAVVDRIQDGEVDHGQHDAVRDVFVAPGGCVLIRADLWRELEGFDPGIVAMGEDLDLSWRSQVAGSRVVVAPDARVRHREAVASGALPLQAAGVELDDRHLTLQGLQRRHELRAVLKCYTWFHLIRVLPQAALLALGEAIVALLARDRQRARAVAGAWVWNARHLRELRAPRRQLAQHRLFPDAEVRRLQLRGSARLNSYFSRLSHQGLDAANAVVSRGGTPRHEVTVRPVLTGSVGTAFSEDSDFDELDDLGHRSGRDRFGRPVRRSFLTTSRQRIVAGLVAALIVLVGTREILFGTFPMVGQLAPLLGWSASWHHFFAGWQPAGVGTTAPSTPAFGLVGIVGTVLLGAMGLTQKVLLLGCLPLGAWGLSRLMRPLVSQRARVVAAICYLGVPLPYEALASGRWDGLVAYAAMPFIVARLARAASLSPFDQVVGHGWRATPLGQTAVLGAIVAAATSFAPAVVPMTLACAVAIALGSVLTGHGENAARLVVEALKAILLAVLLSAPWVIGTVLAGKDAVGIFGLPISAAAAPGWGEVTRFAIGPTVRSPIVWALVAGSALPLLLGKGTRLVWAARMWAMACASWVLAFAVTHGWTGTFTPSESVVLVPAAVAVAAGIGLGISSFENDLTGLAFGWRQMVSALALGAVTLGLLPVVAGAANGRWGLPTEGVEQGLSFLSQSASSGKNFRTLWLGDPRALPVGGWTVQAGLSYALTDEEPPNAGDVWTPAGPGPSTRVSQAVRLAMNGGTVHLGQLMAALSVQYVVVVDGIEPSDTGLAESVAAPPPSGLTHALMSQNDLQILPGVLGIQIFKNAQAIPLTAQRTRPLVPSSVLRWPGSQDVAGWRPVLSALGSHAAATGSVSSGPVFAGYAPAGSFSLHQPGRTVRGEPVFGWAAQYRGVSAGTATLSLHRFPSVPLEVLVETLAWVALTLALLGWPRAVRRRRPPEGATP